MKYKENEWVKVFGKPYQIERLLYSFDSGGDYELTGLLLNGLTCAISVKDVEEKLPNYDLLLHRNNYYKNLLVRTEEYLDSMNLTNTEIFKDIDSVLEDWE